MLLVFFPMLLCNIRCCHSISVCYYASLDAVMQVSTLLFVFRMLLCKSRCCYSSSVCYCASLDAVIRTPYAIMQVSMLLFEFRFYNGSSLGSNGQRWRLICKIMINIQFQNLQVDFLPLWQRVTSLSKASVCVFSIQLFLILLGKSKEAIAQM